MSNLTHTEKQTAWQRLHRGYRTASPMLIHTACGLRASAKMAEQYDPQLAIAMKLTLRLIERGVIYNMTQYHRIASNMLGGK